MNKYTIANRAFKTLNSVLSIECVVENENGFYKEVIYFSINHFKVNKQIIVALDIFSLRTLSFAIRELIQKGETSFIKNSGGNGIRTVISLQYNEYFYINLKKDNLMIGHSFDSYEFRAFYKAVILFCDECEKIIFQIQYKKGKR